MTLGTSSNESTPRETNVTTFLLVSDRLGGVRTAERRSDWIIDVFPPLICTQCVLCLRGETGAVGG